MTGPVGVIGVVQELLITGGVGIICASAIHAAIVPPFTGNENVGGEMVQVYIHCADVPVQSVQVHVYVFVPEQTGSAPITGPVGVIGLLHELFTVGSVGVICASLMQATVDDPLAGNTKVGGDTV